MSLCIYRVDNMAELTKLELSGLGCSKANMVDIQAWQLSRRGAVQAAVFAGTISSYSAKSLQNLCMQLEYQTSLTDPTDLRAYLVRRHAEDVVKSIKGGSRATGKGSGSRIGTFLANVVKGPTVNVVSEEGRGVSVEDGAKSPSRAAGSTAEEDGSGPRTPKSDDQDMNQNETAFSVDETILGQWGPPGKLMPRLLGTKQEWHAANPTRVTLPSDFRHLPEGVNLKVRWRKAKVGEGESLHAFATYSLQKSAYNDDRAIDNLAQVARLRFSDVSGPGSSFFYEGDTLKSTATTTAVNINNRHRLSAHGSGSACSGPEGRELYRGTFHLGTTVRDDSQLTGAVAGSYLGDLEKLYQTQVGIWIRAWRVNGRGAPTHFEVRRDSWDVEDNRTYSAQDMERPEDLVLEPGQHWVGPDAAQPRDWSVPPGVIAWLTRKDRRWWPWLGATCARPSSVAGAVAHTDDTDGLVYCTNWTMGESVYPWYEAIQLRSGRNNTDQGSPRSTALEMGIGCWDTMATVYNGSDFRGGGRPVAGSVQNSCRDVMREHSVFWMYEWGGVTTPRNCVAIMFSPWAWMGTPSGKGTKGLDKWNFHIHGHAIGLPHYGAGANCLAFFNTRSSASGSARAADNRFALLFQGRPVGMPPGWAAVHFGDLWRSAKECPNVPVLTQLVRAVEPLDNRHRTLRLVDPCLLVELDSASRSTGQESPTLWGDLERDFRFGASPVGEQALLLGLAGRGYKKDGTADDTNVTHHTMGSPVPGPRSALLKVKPLEPLTGQEGDVPAGLGKLSYQCERLLDKNLESISPQLFVLKYDCMQNMKGLTFVRGSCKSPFLIRLNKPAGHRVAQASLYKLDFAVSFTFLRRFYHPKLLCDAVKGVWYPGQFVKNPGGHASLLCDSRLSATQPETWDHGTFKAIGMVGSASSDGEARCASGALLALLTSAKLVDNYSLRQVRDCLPHWMLWNELPEAVSGLKVEAVEEVLDSGQIAKSQALAGAMTALSAQQLQSVCKSLDIATGQRNPVEMRALVVRSTLAKTHLPRFHQRSLRLAKFKQLCDTEGPHYGRCTFDLISTPLGRALLFHEGLRRLLVRPVSRSGWNQHVWGVVASDDGSWHVMDPDAGGETQRRVVLTGGLPGFATIQAAYALLEVRSNRKRGKFVLPVPPNFDEASCHYRAFHVAAALRAFAYQAWGKVASLNVTVLDGLPNRLLKDCMYASNREMWDILSGHAGLELDGVSVVLQPLNDGGIRRLWQRSTVGPDAEQSEFVLLEAEVTGGLENVAATYLLYRPSPSAETVFFCPHNAVFKPATKSTIGIRHGQVGAWRVVVETHDPSCTSLDGCEGDSHELQPPLKRHKGSCTGLQGA